MGVILVLADAGEALADAVPPAPTGQDVWLTIIAAIVSIAVAALGAWPLVLKAKRELRATQAAVETPDGQPKLGEMVHEIHRTVLRNSDSIEHLRALASLNDRRVALNDSRLTRLEDEPRHTVK